MGRAARLGSAAAALGAMAAASIGPAAAQERFAGHWVIDHAVTAPWASDPKDRADEADARRLVGQPLAIGPRLMRAPQPLGCARPTFEFRDAGPDTMFEGGLNADGRGRPTDPVAVARSLGVTKKPVRAMTASCSEVEFFLVGPDTILFGLNDRVFTLKRRP